MSDNTVGLINLSHILIMFIPVCIVLVILFKWNLNYKHSIYAIVRMFLQLILVGYILNIIFGTQKSSFVVLIIIVMTLSSSLIAMRTFTKKSLPIFVAIFISIAIGGGISIFLITQVVLDIAPWFSPKEFIPLAGMMLSNCMNGISLAAERYGHEIESKNTIFKARAAALNTSLIPIMNSFLAVGIVSLPGMMTGQILSGISPLIAVRYQIMIMGGIFSSIGISVCIFLWVVSKLKINHHNH